MLVRIATIAWTLFALAATCALAAEHTKDSLATVKKQVAEKKAVLVDVRERDEWDKGHVEGAVLLPMSELGKGAEQQDFAAKLARILPKDKVVYCHCAKGRRALVAGDALKKLGYDVRPLKPGYAELIEAGFPAAPDPAAKPGAVAK